MSTAQYRKEQPNTIKTMFGSIAPTYDRGNAILSFCCHRYWNACLTKLSVEAVLGSREGAYLDLCSGTGDIAFRFLKGSQHPQRAYLLDFCPEMLEEARVKAQRLPLAKHRIDYIEGDAQKIPLPDQSVDCVTVAYGIRNVQSPELCFKEVHRVLKPGGRFGILELTRPKNALMAWGHGWYLRNILPLVGKLFLSNGEAYQYLCNSIQNFVSPDLLEETLKGIGFARTGQRPLMGGIATIVIGKK